MVTRFCASKNCEICVIGLSITSTHWQKNWGFEKWWKVNINNIKNQISLSYLFCLFKKKLFTINVYIKYIFLDKTFIPQYYYLCLKTFKYITMIYLCLKSFEYIKVLFSFKNDQIEREYSLVKCVVVLQRMFWFGSSLIHVHLLCFWHFNGIIINFFCTKMSRHFDNEFVLSFISTFIWIMSLSESWILWLLGGHLMDVVYFGL